MIKPSDKDLIDFIYREARLLDELRFNEWLELFTDDAHYWMPAEWGQTDEKLVGSLMYEDKLLLTVRVERLKGNRTFSQKPKSRCHHVLQMPQIDSRDDEAQHYQIYTPFHYYETRLEEREFYAGWARHSLVVEQNQLKIKLKRVDLVNCDAAFGNIQLFM